MGCFYRILPGRELSWVLFWFVLLVGIYPSDGSAAEITPFRLTDYSAFLQSETSYNNISTGSVDGGMTDTTQLRSRRELGVNTSSYIYHPNLLQMNLSSSIFHDATSLTSGDTETEGSGVSWNLGAFLHFLQKKPYPLTLFFTQSNPLVATGLAESFSQVNREYGGNLRLQKPLTPVNMSISARRSTFQGEGAQQVIDETNDLIEYRAWHKFYRDNQVDLKYNLYHRSSASGSVNLPVRARESIEHNTTLWSHWIFGKEKQYNFREVVNVNASDNPEILSIKASPTFDWRHSSRLRSTYRYNYSTIFRPQNDADSLQHDAIATLQYFPLTNLNGNIGVQGSHAELGEDALQQSYGVSGGANYSRPVPYGNLSLGGNASYIFNHRQASVSRVGVLDEAHTLSGTTSVALNTEFIFLASVVVTNTTQTQTFIEGVDYLLTVIGAQTFVERLVGSPNMTDPQDVLIDYDFDPGGTFDFSSVGLGGTVNLNLARYYNLFARYNERDLTLISGVTTTPLNSSRTIEIGASANVPLQWWGLRVGADARYLRQSEDINSSDSTNFNAYLSLPLPYRSTLQVTGYRGVTTNENSPLGADIIGFAANMNSLPWRNLLLTAAVDHSEDTGGVFKITRTTANFNAIFRLRKVSITANVAYAKQTQGDLDRDSLTATLNARRDIW